ncbi:MAG: DNA-3-methyladenine glycosylase I [Dehalococcoidia bacterium]
MQAPAQIAPSTLGDYLEVMSKAVFQSGISWKVVESKWPGIREAFHGFDAERVAELTEPELEELAQDTRIIRNRRKLDGIVFNARRMLDLERQHGSFRNYLRSHGGFEETLKDIHKQFKYMGDSGTYFFLWVVGEEVPPHDEFCATHERKRR